MKRIIALSLAIILGLFSLQISGIAAKSEETTTDPRGLWDGCPAEDVSATNFLINYFLMYINIEPEEKDDPIAFLATGGLDDDDKIEMLFALIEGDDPLNWILMGDVDWDNKITPEDARRALQMAVGFYDYYEKDSTHFIAADIDRDGIVSPSDARAILRATVGLEEL